MNGISHGDNILKSLHNTLDIALKYGDAGSYENSIFFAIDRRRKNYEFISFSGDADIEKYKEMAKTVCKIEHGFLLGHDIVKEAAKQTSVETFDQVCTQFSLIHCLHLRCLIRLPC